MHNDENKLFYLNEKTIFWNDICITTAYGILPHPPEVEPAFHDHAGYEMHIIASGKGQIITDEKTFNFSKNTAVLIPPRTNHKIIVDPADDLVDLTLSFKYKKISDSRHPDREKLYDTFQRLMPENNHTIIFKGKYYGDFLKKFINENDPDSTLFAISIKNMLRDIYIHILKELQGTVKNSVPSAFKDASAAIISDVSIFKNIEDYIHTFSPDCCLDGLAERLKMSRRNVQRLMMKLYGKSFTKKLAEIRLLEAKTQIEKSDKSLSEIAHAVGYNQYASFHKAFIAYYGISPSEYRK